MEDWKTHTYHAARHGVMKWRRELVEASQSIHTVPRANYLYLQVVASGSFLQSSHLLSSTVKMHLVQRVKMKTLTLSIE
jgi:hypothetical protein